MNEQQLEEIRAAVNEEPCPSSSIPAARAGQYGGEYWMANGHNIAAKLLAEIDRLNATMEDMLCASDDANLND